MQAAPGLYLSKSPGIDSMFFFFFFFQNSVLVDVVWLLCLCPRVGGIIPYSMQMKGTEKSQAAVVEVCISAH